MLYFIFDNQVVTTVKYEKATTPKLGWYCSFIQSAFIQLLVIILCSGLLWSSSTVELEPTQLGSSSLLIFDCSNLLNIKNEIKHEPTKKPFKSSQNHLKKGKIVQFLGILGSFKELLTYKMAFLIA